MHNALKASLENDGYLTIKNFLDPNEVQLLRELCLSNSFNKKDSVIIGDIISHKGFREIVFSKKLISLLEELIERPLVYICDGTARGDDRPFLKSARKFHTDSRADDFDFSKPYPIYRIGLYLQDTDSYSGGLKLRPQSHKKLCIDHGRFLEGMYRLHKYFRKYKNLPRIDISSGINVETKAGDLVIWNMRTHHSGYAVRLKLFPKMSLYPFIENWIPKSWLVPESAKRCVLFFAFGKKIEYLEDYYYYIRNHPDNVQHWEHTDLSNPEVLSLINLLGIELLPNLESTLSAVNLQQYKVKKFF